MSCIYRVEREREKKRDKKWADGRRVYIVMVLFAFCWIALYIYLMVIQKRLNEIRGIMCYVLCVLYW